MDETKEPDWLDITMFGSLYEHQIDANSNMERHRVLASTGQVEAEWKIGPPPC